MSWTNRATCEISAAGPATEFPAWFDVTRYVADDSDAAGWRVTDGRIGALDTPQPARMDLTLRDGTYPPIFPALSDGFGRTVADGWGVADSGQLYTTFGTATDFDVTTGVGTIAPSVTASDKLAAAEVGLDADITVVFAFDALPATGVIRGGAVARYSDSTSHYTAQLWVDAAGVGELRIRRRVEGAQANVLTVAYGAVTPGVRYALRLMVVGPHLRAKVWRPIMEAEPAAWLAVAEDRLLTGGSQAGVFVRDDSAAGGRTVSFYSVSCVDPWAPAGRFTPGNPNSPTYPWWGQSHRIRCYETFGPVRVDVFDGFVEWPEASVRQPDVDQSVSVTAVDRLGRLQNAPTFVGTLAEHIRYHGGDTLTVWYPLHDEVALFAPQIGGATLRPVRKIIGAPSQAPILFPADQDGPVGDDLSYLRVTPTYGAVGVVEHYDLLATIAVAATSGQCVALSVWVYPDASGANPFQPATGLLTVRTTSQQNLIIAEDVLAGTVTASAVDIPSGSSVTLTSTGVLPRDVWRLVSMRATATTGAVQLWVGRDRVETGTMSGSPPTSFSFNEIDIAGLLFGAVGHAQVYVGDPATTFTYADHLAQLEHGFTGLERQRTGERVGTILAYAGVPAGAVDADDGSAVMSRALLAGKTPLAALREAEVTEQGRLFTTGERVVFHSRKRRYDI